MCLLELFILIAQRRRFYVRINTSFVQVATLMALGVTCTYTQGMLACTVCTRVVLSDNMLLSYKV